MAMSSVLMSAAGAAQQVVGSYYSSAGEKISLGLQADLDEINAKLAEGAARDSLLKGERTYGASRLSTAALKGSQKAAIADSGFDVGYGSAAQILTGTDLLGEVDADTIKANAVREAWGHRIEANNLRTSSRVNRSSASTINPGLTAAATLLTAGGQVASQYYGLKSTGAFDKKSNSGPTSGGSGRSGPASGGSGRKGALSGRRY